MIKKLIVLLLLGFALSAVDVEAKDKKPKKVKAPEFDPGAAGAALALAAGGAWVLSQRRRRETGRD